MSIFDFIDTVLSGPKKDGKVSQTDIKKWRNSLANKLSQHKRDNFEAIFGGLDKKEITGKITWLRENPSKHNFTPNEIDLIETKIDPKV
jgi:hypothetical protein